MRSTHARLRVLDAAAGAIAALALLTAPSVQAQEPVSSEFLVNTFTTGTQNGPSVARQPTGPFMVVWSSNGQDGSSTGIYAQLYDAAGALNGGEFRVNTYTTGFQSGPSVAAAANGEFVVVWSSPQDGSGSGVFGQRVGPTGALLGPEFPVNTYTTGNQASPRVAASSSAGNFVVVWDSVGQDGSLNGIFGQCFTPAAAPAGGEFMVNTVTTQYQYLPEVAMNASGTFVVAWMDHPRRHTYAQRYNPNCTPAGGEFQANSGLTPSVGIDAAGRFVVAASALGVDGNSYAILAQRFDAAGASQGLTLVNTYTTGFQEWPGVAMQANGDFVVSWDTYNISSPFGVFRVSTRAFRANGTPAGGEMVLNSYTTALPFQSRGAVGVDDTGNFVVAWTGADGSGNGIKAHRIPSDLIFADGFNIGTLTAWSSSSTDSGDLSADPAAAMASTPFGAQGLIDDTAGLFVQDDSPTDEDRYHARFYFDPNGFDPGVSQNHLRTRILIGFEEAPQRRLFAVVVRRQASGQYSLLGRVRRDDNVQVDTGFFNITDAPHWIEIDWKRSSGPDALDGTFDLSIDGTPMATLTALDNSASAVDFVRMGAMNVKTGASGTPYWDEFVSRRGGAIGP